MARQNSLPPSRMFDVIWESGDFGAGLHRGISPCLHAILANKKCTRSIGGFHESDEAEQLNKCSASSASSDAAGLRLKTQ